ncbi:uncharacterized protein DMAD_01132 [Drosophila madeirensis]|uniref:Uncharacterized protein n=1 Tax=Drosophila madeirensis TaxID=30013 RepID=A0AAU9G025_DROMD
MESVSVNSSPGASKRSLEASLGRSISATYISQTSQTSFNSAASTSSLWNSCQLSSEISLRTAFADCATSDSECDIDSSTKLCPNNGCGKKANCVSKKIRTVLKSLNSGLKWVGRVVSSPFYLPEPEPRAANKERKTRTRCQEQR